MKSGNKADFYLMVSDVSGSHALVEVGKGADLGFLDI
jgi:hypothetical protein